MKCPSCGIENAEGRAICADCGESLFTGEAAKNIAAAGQAPPETAGELQAGIDLFKAGDLDGAIKQFRVVIEKDPTSFQAYNYMGGAYYRKKMFPGAVSSFLRAIELKPDAATVHFNLGLACEGNNMMERAIASYRKALELEPTHEKAAQAIQRIEMVARGEGPAAAKVMCANHPNKEALGKCMECGTPVCIACGREVEAGPRSFQDEDTHESVMCNRCMYAKGETPPEAAGPGVSNVDQMASKTVKAAEEEPDVFTAPKPAPANTRPGYNALEEHEKAEVKPGELRIIRPPAPKQRTYESQHEAAAKRRAIITAEQEKTRSRRRIIGLITTVVLIVGIPGGYIGLCHGVNPARTNLLPYLFFLNRVSPENGSFKVAKPYGWEADPSVTQDAVSMSARVLSGDLPTSMTDTAPHYKSVSLLAFKPGAADAVTGVQICVASVESYGFTSRKVEDIKLAGDTAIGRVTSNPIVKAMGALQVESSVVGTHGDFGSWDLVYRTLGQDGKPVKAHVVVVMAGDFMHIYEYQAPVEIYDKYKPMGDISLRTWGIKTGSVAGTGN